MLVKQMKQMKQIRTGLMALLIFSLFPAAVHAESANTAADAASQLHWVAGAGQTVEVGDGLAELKLAKGLSFLNGADTIAYLKEVGSPPTGKEIGSVFPDAKGQQWAVYFEYEETGHIVEDEKNDINADELLQSYKDGTEQANESLEEHDRLYVDGWDVAPFYDEKLHSLAWSLLAHDASNNKLINYNVRLLTRQGVVSVILVSDPDHLAADRATMEKQVLSAFSLKQGSRYEDYNESTDKKAEYGLTGLILGGAGLVVAKKIGLLATILLLAKKFWFLLIAGIGVVWRVIRSRSGRKSVQETESETKSEEIEEKRA